MRSDRARALAPEAPEAAPLLRFYGELAELQESLFLHPELGAWLKEIGTQDPPNLAALPWDRFEAELTLFLGDAGRIAPSTLQQALNGLRVGVAALVEPIVRGRMDGSHDGDPVRMFAARAFAEPFATRLAVASTSWRGQASPRDKETPLTCPVCGAVPQLAILTDEGSRTGARLLQCGLCATRWPVHRLECPACGETTVEALAQRQTDRWSHVRIDTCQSCRRYVKTVDLRRVRTPAPEVDDLASSALDIWAERGGWTRWGARSLCV
jgi:formate dehydrogenase maturation protein FdhE